MRHVNLGPEFTLPSNEDYDQLIEEMNLDMTEDGGPRAYLGAMRVRERDSFSMQKSILVPLTNHAYAYVMDDPREAYPSDEAMPRARAYLSGALFGTMAHEEFHPHFRVANPYVQEPYVSYLLGAYAESFNQAKLAGEQQTAHRLGVTAMSVTFLRALSDDSTTRMHGWAREMVGEDQVEMFKLGFGHTTFMAWAAYSDMLSAVGRVDEIASFSTMTISSSKAG